LSELREAENIAKNNFQQLKQSLDMQIANDNMQLDGTKKKKAESEEKKATAAGELDVTVKEIKTSEEALALTQKDCMQVAIDHENALKSREEELKVIATAIKIIKDATLVQTSTSFVQTKMETTMMSVQSKVTKTLRRIAQETHSTDLAQLATRIVAMSRSGQFRTSDPFQKIRGMIQDMIKKWRIKWAPRLQRLLTVLRKCQRPKRKKQSLRQVSRSWQTRLTSLPQGRPS
jgi:cell division protein ZapA (FtsZ GTPase activity inhibitor)